MKVPVHLEIRNDKTEEIRKLDGFLLLQYRHGQSVQDDVRLSLVLEDGEEFCSGRYSALGSGRFSYRLRCSGFQIYRGEITVKGWKGTGTFAVPVFNGNLSRPGSSITIVTK